MPDKQTRPADHDPDRHSHAPVTTESKTLAPDAVLSRRDQARAGASTRLAQLPKTIDFGRTVIGTPKALEVPLIVTDGFVGIGVATPTVVDLSQGGDDKAFATSPLEVAYNAFSRAEKLQVQFAPMHEGHYRVALDVVVAWSDGTTTRLTTRIEGYAQDSVADRHGTAEDQTRNSVKELYDNARAARLSLLIHRRDAVNEVGKNLEKADPPPIAQAVIDTAFDFALGLASGGISHRIADAMTKLPTALPAGVTKIAEHAINGWQTAFDDGIKAGVQQGHALINGDTDDSLARDTFLKAQRTALTDAHEEVSIRDNGLERRTMNEIDAAPIQRQADIIHAHAAVAQRQLEAIKETKPSANPLQYRATISGWMQAQAKADLGDSKESTKPGTDLEDAVDTNPTNFYKRDGARGVIHVAFGTKRDRPFSGRVKVSGITQAALAPIRKTRIRELKMPIVVTGYAVDGLIDSMNNGNNEVAFGKNEAGTVYWKGHENGLDALVEASRASTVEGAVKEIIRDDIETMTLEHADNRQ